MDIKTGDTFRFYFPDPITDLFSNANVSNHLSSFKQRNTTHSDKWEVFGGLIFTSFGRGVSFDKLLFTDNFPGATLGCIFFGRVFGRGDLTPCVDNSPYLDNNSLVRHVAGHFVVWYLGVAKKLRILLNLKNESGCVIAFMNTVLSI
ncbi:hypothetical protein HanRHA438_Chr04g0155931 [Helianthus annuus]|nr:hypothetical protein HanIR_Chr04g0156951 [Helianthus annuus]KAJ0925112.1 hypothetical protein HanRHA438_Chr04g0155931 [Helianthus annuus]